jgi:nitroreductase
METLEAIRGRRSIRSYRPDPVPRDLMDMVLRAAMQAPSAANQQAWHFVVVDDRALLDRVPDFHPYCPFIRQAPAAVVVCGDLERERFGGLFWVQDCSAATQNLLLAAHAHGLGTCWLAVYPLAERVTGFRDLLGLPESLVPLCAVTIGFPTEPPRRVDRFRPERVTRNRWPA